MTTRFGLLLGALLCLVTAAVADTIVFTNGAVIRGTFLGGDARTVRIETNNQVQVYRISEVASITFGDAAPAAGGGASAAAPVAAGAAQMAAAQAPQVQAPQAPHLQAPQVQAPQVQAPQVQAPQVQAPQVQAPQMQAPQVQAPQAPQVPAPQAPQLEEKPERGFLWFKKKPKEPEVQAPPAPAMAAAPAQPAAAPPVAPPPPVVQPQPAPAPVAAPAPVQVQAAPAASPALAQAATATPAPPQPLAVAPPSFSQPVEIGGSDGRTIPEGALLRVRMIDFIDSTENQPGETFRASLETGLEAAGDALLPSGSDVTIRLVQIPGDAGARPLFRLDSVGIRVGDRNLPIAAQAVPDPSSGPLPPGTKGLAKLALESDAVVIFRVTRALRVP